MRKDLTDLTLVIDRSGSMSSIKDEAQGGINQFLDDQKKQPGECLLSLVQFDTAYEFVHRGLPIQDVPRFELVPRGMTALLDATGRAIVETGERLQAMAEAERPGLVVFVIVTDGAENSSKEFTLGKVKEMIKHQQDAHHWQFTFLCSGPDAMGQARDMEIKTAGASPVAMNAYLPAYRSASASVGRMRTQTATGQSVTNAYTDEERAAMTGEAEEEKTTS